MDILILDDLYDSDAQLTQALKELHLMTPFATGIEHDYGFRWARLTPQQAMLFILKHPEYVERLQ